jgi:hypothetical protein
LTPFDPESRDKRNTVNKFEWTPIDISIIETAKQTHVQDMKEVKA